MHKENYCRPKEKNGIQQSELRATEDGERANAQRELLPSERKEEEEKKER